MTTTPNNSIKFSDLSAGMEEVIRLDKEGFHYRGQFIADAGEAHRLLVEYLKQNIQPKPEVPTVMEIIALADEIEAEDLGQVDLARAVLQRWGFPAIKPVPVSERLPEPEDCDSEGRCWWSAPETNTKCAVWCFGPKYPPPMFGAISWLPHHALPVPQP